MIDLFDATIPTPQLFVLDLVADAEKTASALQYRAGALLVHMLVSQ